MPWVSSGNYLPIEISNKLFLDGLDFIAEFFDITTNMKLVLSLSPEDWHNKQFGIENPGGKNVPFPT